MSGHSMYNRNCQDPLSIEVILYRPLLVNCSKIAYASSQNQSRPTLIRLEPKELAQELAKAPQSPNCPTQDPKPPIVYSSGSGISNHMKSRFSPRLVQVTAHLSIFVSHRKNELYLSYGKGREVGQVFLTQTYCAVHVTSRVMHFLIGCRRQDCSTWMAYVVVVVPYCHARHAGWYVVMQVHLYRGVLLAT